MRVRITKLPSVRDADLDGLDMRPFIVGGVYDVGQRLADYLIMSGYAVLEMRHGPRDLVRDE